MKPRRRSLSRLLLLMLAAGVACQQYCEDECQSEYEQCVVEAHGDDAKVDHCEGTRDQCVNTCTDQPMDANDGRH